MFFQQTEIIIAGYPGGPKIIADDENGNFVIGWNDHRSCNTGFHIRAMTALLSRKLKTNGQKNAL